MRWLLIVCAILLLVAAGLTGYQMWWIHQVHDLKSRCRAAVRGSGETVPVSELLQLLGTQDAAEFLQELAMEYQSVAFDGAGRFAQIQRGAFQHRDGGRSDVIVLTPTSDAAAARTEALWYGPSGFRVAELAFRNGELAVQAEPTSVDGQVHPETYKIPWLSGEEPTSGRLGSQNGDQPD